MPAPAPTGWRAAGEEPPPRHPPLHHPRPRALHPPLDARLRSRGNAVVVGRREGDAADAAWRLLLLDVGFDLPELVARLHAAGLHPWDVEGVVLTHGHRDHVRGAADAARAYGWRPWVALGTVWRWRDLREVPHEGFAPGDAFDVGPFRVRSVEVPHDVPDAAAFVVDDPATGARAAYATDLGAVPEALVGALAGVHALVLEANHDPALLAAGPYPPEVRTRVAGPHGHLSNAQTAELLRRVAHPGWRTWCSPTSAGTTTRRAGPRRRRGGARRHGVPRRGARRAAGRRARPARRRSTHVGRAGRRRRSGRDAQHLARGRRGRCGSTRRARRRARGEAARAVQAAHHHLRRHDGAEHARREGPTERPRPYGCSGCRGRPTCMLRPGSTRRRRRRPASAG
jgi:phosphoribosyl 1,2-cyclic phosphodiesterase